MKTRTKLCLTDEAVRQIQEEVDQQWARLVERARTHAVLEAAPH